MDKHLEPIKEEILRSLAHQEAEEGLYFRNFLVLHEEDERPAVHGSEIEILDALKQLLHEGQVDMDDSGSEVIFHLHPKMHH